MQALGDIRRLFLNGNEDVASLIVEALCRVIISDVLDGTTDDPLVVKSGLGRDLISNLVWVSFTN
jgi:hypothetical protein